MLYIIICLIAGMVARPGKRPLDPGVLGFIGKHLDQMSYCLVM